MATTLKERLLLPNNVYLNCEILADLLRPEERLRQRDRKRRERETIGVSNFPSRIQDRIEQTQQTQTDIVMSTPYTLKADRHMETSKIEHQLGLYP